MPLKIVTEADPIEITSLIGVVYAYPGVGKTTMGFTCERPLLFACDPGLYRAKNRKDAVVPKSWSEIATIGADELKPYRTVIIDTVGALLDLLTAEIIRSEPKLGIGGVLSQQGWGKLKNRFTTWLTFLRGHGLDVLLLAHSTEKQQGDDLIQRLDIQGGAKDVTYKAVDFMGRLFYQDGQRTLTFSPTDTAMGKNPANLEDMLVPDTKNDPKFMAGVLEKIKAALNEQSAQAQAASVEMNAWVDEIAGLKAAEDFNKRLERVKAASTAVRALFNTAAVKAGLVYEKASAKYVIKAPAAEKQATPEPAKDPDPAPESVNVYSPEQPEALVEAGSEHLPSHEELVEEIGTLLNAKDFNETLPKFRQAPKHIQAMFQRAATAKGLMFSNGKYIKAKQPPAKDPAPPAQDQEYLDALESTGQGDTP